MSTISPLEPAEVGFNISDTTLLNNTDFYQVNRISVYFFFKFFSFLDYIRIKYSLLY